MTKEYPKLILALMGYMRGEVFEVIEGKIRDNVFSLSGIDTSRPSTKQPIFPDQYDGDPTDYLKDTPFEELFTTPVPFCFSKKALSEHGIIIAKPGHGKTQLLSNLVIEFLNDPAKPGIFCLDPAGDWFEKLRDRVDPSRVVVLDPETDPPPLNFFDFKNSTPAETLQSFFYLMSSLSGGLQANKHCTVSAEAYSPGAWCQSRHAPRDGE